MSRLRTTLTGIAAGALLVTGGLTSHALTTPEPNHVSPCGSPGYADACLLTTEHDGFPDLDTADYGTDIPRCASDDYNADHVARCYTERVTDNAVIVIDADDQVLATITG